MRLFSSGFNHLHLLEQVKLSHPVTILNGVAHESLRVMSHMYG